MATPPRPTFQVPGIPGLPSPSGSRPRASISSSFSFDPSHLVNSFQHANSARGGNKRKDSFALDPNRSVLPVSPLRSSPRRPRKGHSKSASLQNTTHPLANDSTADVFDANVTEYEEGGEEEEDIEWGMIDRMRLWRHDAMMQHLYETAAFWGDKVLSWTNDKNDAFWLAQVYFMTHQYSRAERLLTRPFSTSFDGEDAIEPLTNGHALPHTTPFAAFPGPSMPGGALGQGGLLDKGKGKETFSSAPSVAGHVTFLDIGANGDALGRLPMGSGAPDMVAEQFEGVVKLVDVSVACRYLAAQCQVRQGKWAEAMEMLGEINPFRETTRSGPQIPNVDGGIKIEASMCHLRGLLMLKLNRGESAKECFMEALALDVKCYDAFDQLVSGEMMTTDEEWEFVQGLAYKEQTPEDADFVRLIYTARLRKYKHAEEHALTRRRLTEEFGLSDNPDVLYSFADALYTQFRWADCYAITSRILSLVSVHAATMPLHIACMHHLPHLRSKLFILAHELVEKEPEAAMSWYAVGVWYLTSKKWSEARTYFSKTSLMDPRFGPAWIAFAHTFALEGEHDHAITAYSTCARLFTGSHLPLMFVGMEQITLSNHEMADEALNAANSMCDGDPLLFNERGVMAFNRGDYEGAVNLFLLAIDLARDTQGSHSTWATTFVNLGTAYGKLGEYAASRDSYKKVLEMDPRHAMALALLGKTYFLMNDTDAAIVKYHESLSIDPISTHVIELLNLALDATMLVEPGMQKGLPRADDVWAAGMRREQERARAVAKAKVRDNGPNWRDEEMNVE